MSLSAIGDTITFGEAHDLVWQLAKESGSHLFMDLAGYDVAATQAEVAQIIHAEWYMNVHRDTKKVKKPIELPRPWSAKDPNADVTPERRAELKQQLLARSAFRDR